MNVTSMSNMNGPNANPPPPPCAEKFAAGHEAENPFLKIQKLMASNKLKMQGENSADGDTNDAAGPNNKSTTDASKMEQHEERIDKASDSWRRLSLVLKDSKTESLGTLREEMAHLRDILLDCRHENEELLQDTQALFDENECLVQDLHEVLEDKSKLETKLSVLAEKLETTMVELESKEQEVVSLKQTAARSPFGSGRRTNQRGSVEGDLFSTSSTSGESTHDELGMQVSSLKAESKRQKRSWDLERSRLLEQYNKDQIEKEALREMAQESFLKMKETARENKKLQKEATRLARLLETMDEGDELKHQPVRWGFVNRVMQRKEGSKKNCEQEENSSIVDVSGEKNNIAEESNNTLSTTSCSIPEGNECCSSPNETNCNLDQSMHISFDDDDEQDDRSSALKDFDLSVSSRVMELSLMLDDQSARSSISSIRSSVRSSAVMLSLRQSMLDHNGGPLINEDILEEEEESEEESEKESDSVNANDQIHEDASYIESTPVEMSAIAEADTETKEGESTAEDDSVTEPSTEKESDLKTSACDAAAQKKMPGKWPNARWPLPEIATLAQRRRSDVLSKDDDQSVGSSVCRASKARGLPLGRNVFKRPPAKNNPAA